MFLIGSARAEESWFVILLEGDRAGHVHQMQVGEDDQITTSTTLHLSVGRGTAVIDVDLDSRFVETAAGEPVEASSSMNLGGTPIRTAMVFGPDGVEVTTAQGDQTSTARQPRSPVAWLPPAAASRYVERQLADGAETITVTTIDPAMGLVPFTSTMNVVGQENIEVFGRVVPATVWEATVSNLPGVVVREYVDATGNPLKSTVSPMPGLEMTVVLADKLLALSPLDPPELMVATLIEPTGEAIKRPRRLIHARYHVSAPDDSELIATDAQRVKLMPHAAGVADKQPWEVRVTVASHPVGEAPTAEETQAALMSSLVLNHEDTVVVAMRDEALSKLRSTDPPVVAETLRRYVHNTIDTKDLSVGFATASEVARTKQGDCTEHAVLLAALLRGAGIPARGVSGLIYADQFLGKRGIFGYHMWTQAWLDPDGDDGPAPPRWVDLDATLDADTPFDATHIALSVTDLNDPSLVNDMVQLAPLLGNLEIKVIEVEYDD